MDLLEIINDQTNSVVESPSRAFSCPWENCSKSFNRKSDLQRHHRIHTNERPYSCTHQGCGKSFIQRSALTVHIRTHTGEKPHQCEYIGCEKCFSDSSSLARHRRIHTGKRPYICPLETCGKSFCRKTTLTKHARRTHSIRTENDNSEDDSESEESEDDQGSPQNKPRESNGGGASGRISRKNSRKGSISKPSRQNSQKSTEAAPRGHANRRSLTLSKTFADSFNLTSPHLMPLTPRSPIFFDGNQLSINDASMSLRGHGDDFQSVAHLSPRSSISFQNSPESMSTCSTVGSLGPDYTFRTPTFSNKEYGDYAMEPQSSSNSMMFSLQLGSDELNMTHSMTTSRENQTFSTAPLLSITHAMDEPLSEHAWFDFPQYSPQPLLNDSMSHPRILYSDQPLYDLSYEKQDMDDEPPFLVMQTTMS